MQQDSTMKRHTNSTRVLCPCATLRRGMMGQSRIVMSQQVQNAAQSTCQERTPSADMRAATLATPLHHGNCSTGSTPSQSWGGCLKGRSLPTPAMHLFVNPHSAAGQGRRAYELSAVLLSPVWKHSGCWCTTHSITLHWAFERGAEQAAP
jgi:hypothetical protein